MAIRGEETPSKLVDTRIGSSWIPETPAKLSSSNQQPICANWQENRPVTQGNVDEPRTITEAMKEFDTWQAGNAASSQVHIHDSCIYDKFPANDADQWSSISFGKLLALAESKCNNSAIENALGNHIFATGSTSGPNFHPQNERSQFTLSFGNSSRQEQGSLLGANFDAELNMQNFVTSGNSIPSRHFFDLNAPPRMMADASLRGSTSSQFEPITPEKTNKAECTQESAVQDSGIYEVTAEKEKEITTDGVKEPHMLNERSTQSEENHKPDKEGTDEANLTKTPQQKARRRKHRPKVIIEGQKKSTPKSSARKPSGPPETKSVRRKYVRKQRVENPIGGETNGSDLVNKTPNSMETSASKRKYTRKKIDNPGDVDKGTTETTDVKGSRYPLRSCRRTLNFDSDVQVEDGNSTYCPPSNCHRESQAENFNTQETEEMMRENEKVPSNESTLSKNQVQEDYLSRPEQHSQSPLPSTYKDKLENIPMLTDQIACTRGKCQIVFSDVTHDKEAKTVQVSMNPNGQLTPKSPSDSICSSTTLTPEKQERGLKRKSINTAVEAELSNTNGTGAYYNSLQAYTSIFFHNAVMIDGTPGLHFPTIYKKKRTEKVYSTVTSSMQIGASTSDTHAKLERHNLKDSCTSLFTSPINLGSCGGLGQVNNLLTNTHATYSTQNGRQVFEDLLALGPTQRIKKRRSKGPTRRRDLASLLEELPASRGYATTTSRFKQGIKILHEPHTCMEALVADTRSTISTKKRSKRSILINSTMQNLYNDQKFATTSTGPPLALTWKTVSPIDSIIEQLNQLDLNAESSQASERKRIAFMAYRGYYQEQHALVPYHNSGALVPFDSSFDHFKRRRPRPKVDLDDETTRVWKLLLEDINSEGIDGTDEEKVKWWEEERRVFRGRADSFIARMHLVQGDRRFSPWKGSVVDSVVGVFLTQNVSDHLSSSAFMSMAARYPIKSKIHSAELHKEKLGSKSNESEKPEVCVLDSDGPFGPTIEILNQSVCGEDIKMLHELEDCSIREVNNVKSSGNTSDEFIPKNDLRGQSIDNSTHEPIKSSETATDKSVSLIEDGRDTEDTLSSQTPEISSQDSANSPVAQPAARTDSYLLRISEEEPTVGVKANGVTNSASFVKLLQMAGTVLHGTSEKGSEQKTHSEHHHVQSESSASNLQTEDHLGDPTFLTKTIACGQSTLCHVPNSGAQEKEFHLSQRSNKSFDTSSNKELCETEISELSSESACGITFQKTAVSFEEVQKNSSPNAHSSNNGHIEASKRIVGIAKNKMQGISKGPAYPQSLMDAIGSSGNIDSLKNSELKEVNSNKNELFDHPGNMVNGAKVNGGRPRKEKENQVDWDHLRKQTGLDGRDRPRPANNLDSVDWETVRCADVNEIAQTIKERGMNNMLAERIKDFLNRIVRDHGSIDLEWLRDIPPDKAKEYLLSIRGLGLKSVECVRLLTLHHLAFPVDTNVGRIAVRLGWVPLQPLPESLQLHLLELYPVLESIQKYLWPRLCKLDQKTLYELHYQMITFGKVFCTKSKPNCNACPMRGECRHFASAFASARLSLPAPQDKSIVSATENRKADQNPIRSTNTLQLPSTQANGADPESGASNSQPFIEEPPTPEPIIEMPATPEPDRTQVLECDIENSFEEDPDEIPTIQLNMEEFTHNLQTIMQQQNTELQEFDMSKALVALTSQAASIPVPKLKNISRLRTEHQVYELPDSHQLLEGMDKREPDDPSPYLLAIWTPGETMNSIEPPERRCSSQELGKLCSDETCSSCNSIREADSQTVRGTLLIPCRTAMRGSFPLNGTYFQVNEVFSDHESSLCPLDVPREWLWNLPRRTVYFGTSIPTIFKGLSTEGIQYCFWRGFVCVRGFDRRTRAPRPLIARLHFPASKLAKGKGKIDENNA